MTLKVGANLGLLSGGAPGEEHYDEIVAQWRGIDALLQGSVASTSVAAPPASPSDGDCYIIPTDATGAWAGKTDKIARWTTDTAGSKWEYYTPKIGWKIFNQALSQDVRYTGSAWENVTESIPYENSIVSVTVKLWLNGVTGTLQWTDTADAYFTKIGTRIFVEMTIPLSISYAGGTYHTIQVLGLPICRSKRRLAAHLDGTITAPFQGAGVSEPAVDSTEFVVSWSVGVGGSFVGDLVIDGDYRTD